MTSTIIIDDNNEVKSIRTKLGYSSETKEKLKPLSLNEILSQSTKLNDAPIEKIQELINKRIVDIVVIPKGDKSKCKSHPKSCNTTQIEFQIMFENIMVGFKHYGGDGTVLATHYYRFITKFNSNFDIKNFARRGGYMFLSVIYTHHTTGHKTGMGYNPFRYKFDRSPFNMNLLPHVRSQYEKGIYLMKHLKMVYEYSKKKPTIENHLAFRKEYNFEIIHSPHVKDSICDCKQEVNEDGLITCDEAFHTQEEYCLKYCRKKDILTNYISHPQYYHHSENYCAGTIQDNPDGKQARLNRNVFQYINNLIHGIQNVNEGDSRDGFEIYYNVFVNANTLFEETETFRLTRKIYSDIREHMSYDNVPQELMNRMQINNTHLISAKCYCISCVAFKIALSLGLRFSKELLVLGDSTLVSKDEFESIKSHIMNGNFSYSDDSYFRRRWGNNVFLDENRVRLLSEWFDVILSIDPLDTKYHVSISRYDLRHLIFNGGLKKQMMIKYFDSTYGIPISQKQSLVFADLVENWRKDVIRLAGNRLILNKMNSVEGVNIDKILEMMNKVKLKMLDNARFKPFHPDQTKAEWDAIGKLIKKG